MKSLELHIQSSIESLNDCLSELRDALELVTKEELAESEPLVSSAALDRIVAHCQKAQRELQNASGRLR